MTPEQEVAHLRSQVLELSDRLDALEKVRDQEIEQIPPLEDDPGVPRVGNVQLLSYSGTNQLDEVVIGFEEPRDHPAATNVEAYELWTKGTTSVATDFVQVAEATRSPFVLPIASNVTGVLTAVVRTRMKGGLGTPVDSSPSLAINVTALSSEIAANSITNSMLQRSGPDPIQIVNADILNVDGAKINDASITTAKIVSLEAGKISAGTVNSVNINAGTYTLLSGNNQMFINGTNGFYQINTATGNVVRLLNGTFQARNSSNFATAEITTVSGEGNVTVSNSSGQIRGFLGSLFSSGLFELRNSSGIQNTFIYADGSQLGLGTGTGAIALDNASGTNRVNIGTDTSDRGVIGLSGTGGIGAVLQAGNSSTVGLFINGQRVVAGRQSTVSDPTGGVTQDAEARTAINAIIDRLQAHGLIS